MSHKFELGEKVEDLASGVQGIAIGRIEYMNGCVQYLVKPRAGEDGKMPDGHWIDDAQLIKVDLGIIDKIRAFVKETTGGPGPSLSSPPTEYRNG